MAEASVSSSVGARLCSYFFARPQTRAYLWISMLYLGHLPPVSSLVLGTVSWTMLGGWFMAWAIITWALFLYSVALRWQQWERSFLWGYVDASMRALVECVRCIMLISLLVAVRYQYGVTVVLIYLSYVTALRPIMSMVKGLLSPKSDDGSTRRLVFMLVGISAPLNANTGAARLFRRPPKSQNSAAPRPTSAKKDTGGARYRVVDEGPHFNRTARGCLVPT